jgi:hypothetical protein
VEPGLQALGAKAVVAVGEDEYVKILALRRSESAKMCPKQRLLESSAVPFENVHHPSGRTFVMSEKDAWNLRKLRCSDWPVAITSYLTRLRLNFSAYSHIDCIFLPVLPTFLA